MTLPPIVTSLVVPLPPDRAFDLFVRRMGEWWPLGTHAVSPHVCNAPARRIEVPPFVGGTVTETRADSGTAPWGSVTAYAPGSCLEMTWPPGTDPAQATTVRVDFAAEGPGTRVTLTHSGWEHRADAADARPDYVTGWEGILGRDFREAALAAAGQAGAA